MKKLILGLSGILILALPQVAGAQIPQSQAFKASFEYVAKFVCGRGGGGDTRSGVVEGHYNTILNVLAIRNTTAVSARATWVSEDLDEGCSLDRGEPSSFSERSDLDRDEAVGINCSDIKDLTDCSQGLFEGFVTIYSSGPLEVTDVITGQGTDDGDGPLSVMEVYQVKERTTDVRVTPSFIE